LRGRSQDAQLFRAPFTTDSESAARGAGTSRADQTLPASSSSRRCRIQAGKVCTVPPNASTGLDADACFAAIEGTTTWTPRLWDVASLADLRSWVLDNPPSIPTEDPYLAPPELLPEPLGVCAVIPIGKRTYRLETFEDAIAVERAGGIVTHGYACGRCSSLPDLAAYAEAPDQTGPVRQCALETLGGTVEELASCIEDRVGFTPPCARTWPSPDERHARVLQRLHLEPVLTLQPTGRLPQPMPAMRRRQVGAAVQSRGRQFAPKLRSSCGRIPSMCRGLARGSRV